MICPVCSSKTRIAGTYNWEDGTFYRRRECLECGYKFSTYETMIKPKRNAKQRPYTDKFLDVALKRY